MSDTQHPDHDPETNELTDPLDILHDVLTDLWNTANEPMWALTDLVTEGMSADQIATLTERTRAIVAKLQVV